MKSYTKIMAGAALLALSSQASFAASFTAADGNTWLQLSDTNNVSFNEVDGLCPAGLCVGTLSNGTNIAGYTFASNQDVQDLFGAYAGVSAPAAPSPFSDPVGFATYSTTYLLGSGWNTDFNAGFGTLSAIAGFSINSAENLNLLNNLALAPLVLAVGGTPSFFKSTNIATILAGSSVNAGAYLYKVSAVPVPAALLMFAPALLGFLGLRRKARA